MSKPLYGGVHRDGFVLGGTKPIYVYSREPLGKAFDNLVWLMGVHIINSELPTTSYCLGLSFQDAKCMIYWNTRRRWLALLLDAALQVGVSVIRSPRSR